MSEKRKRKGHTCDYNRACLRTKSCTDEMRNKCAKKLSSRVIIYGNYPSGKDPWSDIVRGHAGTDWATAYEDTRFPD